MKQCILLSLILSLIYLLPSIPAADHDTYENVIWLLNRQEGRQAETAIDRFLVQYPHSPKRIPLLLHKAKLLRARGALQDAEVLLTDIVDAPLNHQYKLEIINELAIVLYHQNRLPEAELSLQRLISEFSTLPSFQQYHYWRGMINLKSGQPHSALHSFQQAANLGLTGAELDHHLFTLYLMLDREDVARSILQSHRNTIMNSSLPMYVQWLQYLLNHARHSELESEISALEIGFSDLPGPIQSLMIRSRLESRNYRSAMELLLLSGIESDENRYYYAMLQSVAGELAKAAAILEQLYYSGNSEIAHLSRMERMKILFRQDPQLAIQTVTAMLDEPMSSRLKGNLYFLLAAFQYHQNDLSKAMRFFLLARKHEIEPSMLDTIDALIPEIWFNMESYRNASVTFNRYLNIHPRGAYRDKALYILAVLSYMNKDYQSFRAIYNRFMEDHANSPYADQARFYAAEVDFNLANYSRALPVLQWLHNRYPADMDIMMRLAQTHYYLGDYLEAKVLVNAIPDHQINYDTTILNASIHFNEKDYMRSLDFYRSAANLAPNEVKRIEALSYQALVLYQLRRFKDASDLYFKIAREKGTPETYLYMAAKSAAHARNFHQALMIYDSFLTQYPNSRHYIRVLNDIANVYFNMGNYDGAIQTWNNVLRRYISKKSFTEEELLLLKEVFAGLDYSFRHNPRDQFIDELITMIDAFQSEYIQFELQYLLVKLYAESRQWQNLLRQAEDLKRQFPQRYVKELEILTAESLIQLNEYDRAESVFVNILNRDGMNEILFEWVNLDILSNQYDAAVQKLRSAYLEAPDQQIWLMMLDIAYQYDLSQFETIWAMPASDPFREHPEALKLRMLYLYESDNLDEAEAVADRLVALSTDAIYDAYATLVQAIVLYNRELFLSALQKLNRLLVLYPDMEDIAREAIFYVVLCQFAANNLEEAKIIYQSNLHRLGIDQIRFLESLLVPKER